MNLKFVKRRYMESRAGAVVINPILQASNFIMLAYITINESIPFWLFAPVFLISMVGLVTVVGFKFRQIQLSTDENMKYEKQTENAKTNLQILLAVHAMLVKNNIKPSEEFEQRIIALKTIASHEE